MLLKNNKKLKSKGNSFKINKNILIIIIRKINIRISSITKKNNKMKYCNKVNYYYPYFGEVYLVLDYYICILNKKITQIKNSTSNE